MGTCCALIRLSNRNIDALLRQPALVHGFVGREAESAPAPRGFFARLFGKKSPPPAKPRSVVNLNLSDPREEGDEIDVDKAWQAIHFLMTGTTEPTGGPSGFIMSGGTEISGADIGNGPPRVFKNSEVVVIITALRAFDREEFRRRYKPHEMDHRNVYPQIWARDGEKGFEYIWYHFEHLRSFLERTEDKGLGLLVFFC